MFLIFRFMCRFSCFCIYPISILPKWHILNKCYNPKLIKKATPLNNSMKQMLSQSWDVSLIPCKIISKRSGLNNLGLIITVCFFSLFVIYYPTAIRMQFILFKEDSLYLDCPSLLHLFIHKLFAIYLFIYLFWSLTWKFALPPSLKHRQNRVFTIVVKKMVEMH